MPPVEGGGGGRIVDFPLDRVEFVGGAGETAGGAGGDARNGPFPPALLPDLAAGGKERERARRGDVDGEKGGAPQGWGARRTEVVDRPAGLGVEAGSDRGSMREDQRTGRRLGDVEGVALGRGRDNANEGEAEVGRAPRRQRHGERTPQDAPAEGRLRHRRVAVDDHVAGLKATGVGGARGGVPRGDFGKGAKGHLLRLPAGAVHEPDLLGPLGGRHRANGGSTGHRRGGPRREAAAPGVASGSRRSVASNRELARRSAVSAATTPRSAGRFGRVGIARGVDGRRRGNLGKGGQRHAKQRGVDEEGGRQGTASGHGMLRPRIVAPAPSIARPPYGTRCPKVLMPWYWAPDGPAPQPHPAGG